MASLKANAIATETSSICAEFAAVLVYECGCADIRSGDCDCNGNQLDECGICNGPGAIYECGCSGIPMGECDCNGNVLDDCGVCGGDGSTCLCENDPTGLCYDFTFLGTLDGLLEFNGDSTVTT